MLGGSPSGVVTLDLEEHVDYANPAALRLLETEARPRPSAAELSLSWRSPLAHAAGSPGARASWSRRVTGGGG